MSSKNSVFKIIVLTIVGPVLAGGVAHTQTATPQISVLVSNYNPSTITGFSNASFEDPQPADNPPIAIQSNGVSGPEDVTEDHNGNIWISNVYNGSVTGYASPIQNLAPSFVVTSPLINIPTGLVSDASSNLFVASVGTNSITLFANPAANGGTSPLYTIAGSATGISQPDHLALDATGNLYVANEGNSTITVFPPIDPVTNVACVTTSSSPNCNVSPSFTIGGSSTLLVDPRGVSLDSSGDLFVSNRNGNSVVIFSASSLASCAAVSGNCNASPSAVIAGSNTGFDQPVGVSVVGGTLYVCNIFGDGTPNSATAGWTGTGSITVYNDVAVNGGAQNPSPTAILSGPNSQVNDCNAIFAQSTYEAVSIEIKPPAAAPVPIDPGANGVTPVAILSSASFDATTVDPSSVKLDGGAATKCTTLDVNGDGLNDLKCNVTTQTMAIPAGTSQATLTGQTSGGQPIQGQEQIVAVPH